MDWAREARRNEAPRAAAVNKNESTVPTAATTAVPLKECTVARSWSGCRRAFSTDVKRSMDADMLGWRNINTRAQDKA